MDAVAYRLSVPFAIVAGTGAGVLAAVLWPVLRGSPFGTVLKLLALAMSLTTVYHGGLLVAGSETAALQSLLVLGYVLVAAALAIAASELRGPSRGAALEHGEVVAVTLVGLLLYAVGGSLSEVFLPRALHWVHGGASLVAVGALYGPVRDDLRSDPGGGAGAGAAGEGQPRPGWMVPMDDAILGVLAGSGLVLTPAVVAYNTGYSREEVNRRLRRLESEGLVERVERGKYLITDRGEEYVDGATASRDDPGL